MSTATTSTTATFEAQQQNDVSVTVMPPAYHDASPSPQPTPISRERTTDPIDDFFGCTRESRHDRRLSAQSTNPDALPTYRDVEALPLPAYTKKGQTEPVTLSMYLFKFGFLFPPFWLLGALILLSPLSAPPDTSSEPELLAWLPDKTPSEREAIVREIRRVEVKWAKRSLGALLVFSALMIAGGLAIWAVLRG